MKSILVLLAFFAGISFSAFAQDTELDLGTVETMFSLASNTLRCKAQGFSCSSGSECCSRRCRNGACYEFGSTCGGEGAACRTSFDCCSNSCNGRTCR